jgi:hypothetical protein
MLIAAEPLGAWIDTAVCASVARCASLAYWCSGAIKQGGRSLIWKYADCIQAQK